MGRIFEIHAAAATDVGKVRIKNEDNLYFDGIRFSAEENISSTLLENTDSRTSSVAFAVFDGMGGERSGERASEIAARNFEEYLGKLSQNENERSVRKRLDGFYKAANKAVDRFSRKISATSGTTASALVLFGGQAVVSNIGDSPIFRIRFGKTERLFEEHTVTGLMLRSGVLTPEQAKLSAGKGALLRFIGAPKDEYDFLPYVSDVLELEDGDVFLLCSDGLTDMVGEEEIAAVAGDNTQTCAQRVQTLVSRAIEQGGKDNCTVTIVQISKNNE